MVPDFEDEGESDIVIPESDMEIVAFVRASGPGGQNVNKVATAVRIVHIPTGIQVTCSVERSQQQNKRLAIALLTGRLEMIEQAKRDEELKKIYGEKGQNAFGSQIRSYVLDDRASKITAPEPKPATSKAFWIEENLINLSMLNCADASAKRNDFLRF